MPEVIAPQGWFITFTTALPRPLSALHIMQLLTISALLGLATLAFSQYTVIYDEFYDGNLNSLNSVACSTGDYGLITYGYNTFGQIPTYPMIGGAPQIQGWNSPNCGTCWNLTYTDPHGGSSSVTFTAINLSGDPGRYTISFAGMDELTNGNALTLDGASISATQLPESACAITF